MYSDLPVNPIDNLFHFFILCFFYTLLFVMFCTIVWLIYELRRAPMMDDNGCIIPEDHAEDL